MIFSVTVLLSRSSKVLYGGKLRLSRVFRILVIIDRKADIVVKVVKLKIELYFVEDEAVKIAELKKFRLIKELVIVEVEMKVID